MLTLYDFHDSGNGYKIRLLLHFLQRPYRYVEVDILNGASRTPEFLRRNPNGRIPVLELEDGRTLSESNAVLFYLAQDSAFWPADTFAQAQLMSWMFFEQYSHEPNIATSRFIRKHRELDAAQNALLEMKRAPGIAALELMDSQLVHTDWLVGQSITIADIALYAYTHVAAEGGFDLSPYSGIDRWLQCMAKQTHYVSINHTDGLA
ncbi:MAG: glutathione S-transferase family protein [Gammaproteobacteria bacterium]